MSVLLLLFVKHANKATIFHRVHVLNAHLNVLVVLTVQYVQLVLMGILYWKIIQIRFQQQLLVHVLLVRVLVQHAQVTQMHA